MVKLTVNGKAQTYDGDPAMPLLWYLRDDLRLTVIGSAVNDAMPSNCNFVE